MVPSIFCHLKSFVLIFNYASIKFYKYWFSTVHIRTCFVRRVCFVSSEAFIEQRYVIKFCVKFGKITIETNEMIRKVQNALKKIHKERRYFDSKSQK